MENTEGSDTKFEMFLAKYCPISQDNNYGVIPLIGMAVSFYSAALFLYITENCLRLEWSVIPLCLGLLTFVVTGTLWGFRAKQIDFLKLWLKVKGVEAICGSCILTMAILNRGPRMANLVICAILNLVLVFMMIYIGVKKYKYLKNIQKKNAEVDDDHPLQDVKDAA